MEGFLQQSVTLVFFVGKNARDRRLRPFLSAARCGDFFVFTESVLSLSLLYAARNARLTITYYNGLPAIAQEEFFRL